MMGFKCKFLFYHNLYIFTKEEGHNAVTRVESSIISWNILFVVEFKVTLGGEVVRLYKITFNAIKSGI